MPPTEAAEPVGRDAVSASSLAKPAAGSAAYTGGKDDSAHNPAATYAGAWPSAKADLASLEAGGKPPLDQRKNVTQSAGHWYNASWHIATTICTPAAYAPLALAFAWLGWPAGVLCLLTAAVVSCYNSYLLTLLHEEPGTGRRRVRYAQIAEEVYGPVGYWSVTFFQQVASLGNNIAVEIGAALAMQTIYNVYNPDGGNMTTQKMIVIFAAAQLVLSQLPDIHHLSYLNLFCTICTVGFTITCLGLNIYVGRQWRNLCDADPDANAAQCLDFSYGGGVSSSADLTFGVFSALGTIAFGFGDTILPEIQATIKAPHAHNTQMGLFAAYAIITCNYFSIAVSGYWGFGFAATAAPWLPVIYAPPAVSEAQNWALTLVNLFGILQIAGCFQIYCRPTYEWADIHLQDATQGPWAKRNVLARLGVTLVYSCLMTLVACAIPFFGDFVALVGAVGFVPLDFIVPMVLYNKAKKPPLGLATFHNVLAFIFTIIAFVGFIGAVRWINVHIHMYHFFGNIGAPLAPPPPYYDYPYAANSTQI